MSDWHDDAPAAKDLLHASGAHLRKVAAGLDADNRYNLLLAARAADIAWRDRSLSAAHGEAQRAIARAVNGADAATAIRAGDRDGDVVLHGALLASTAIATYATRPDLLREKERNAVEDLLT